MHVNHFFSIFTVINISKMKGIRIVLLIAIFSLTALSCLEQKDRLVTVKGALSHLGGTDLYITYTDTQFKRVNDTIHSSMSGKFYFKLRTYNDLAPITIYFKEKKCWTTLFAEPGDHITVRGNIESVDLLTIRGGQVNNDLNRFKMQIRNLYQERLDLLKGTYTKEDASEVRMAEINLQLKRAAKDFISENPSSIASVILIQDFFYQEYDPNTSELLGLLKDNASNCHLAEKIRDGISKRR